MPTWIKHQGMTVEEVNKIAAEVQVLVRAAGYHEAECRGYNSLHSHKAAVIGVVVFLPSRGWLEHTAASFGPIAPDFTQQAADTLIAWLKRKGAKPS